MKIGQVVFVDGMKPARRIVAIREVSPGFQVAQVEGLDEEFRKEELLGVSNEDRDAIQKALSRSPEQRFQDTYGFSAASYRQTRGW